MVCFLLSGIYHSFPAFAYQNTTVDLESGYLHCDYQLTGDFCPKHNKTTVALIVDISKRQNMNHILSAYMLTMLFFDCLT